MKKFKLRDHPSQEFIVSLNSSTIRMRWMYNSAIDRWSITAWLNDEACPRIAGKRVLPNINLFDGYDFYGADQIQLWVIPRASDRSDNWYERLAKPSFDYALIALVTPSEIDQIITRIESKSEDC